ncbi:MAG: uridine diphosphate-N-acetylglucosamine-binding protein YvcK [Anaerolineae bacterium]|nr:uridine diphosphate-N-acetylglucosamine-binding protein YvcK [Anaerolineae bacterium]MCX8068745.1 uridine diphosphate-N-acetylglucosamine-binding protein YvcK [Anaerolineae bacterium]MDW7992314.1 uridine diphosphate-N-acetylglucosamine-binding protein YvcK [Anaerolineae bacterium]
MSNRLSSWWKWLRPGIGVKRWALVLLFGMVLLGMGLDLLLHRVALYPRVLFGLPTRALPGWVWSLLLIGAGIGMGALGLVRMNRALLSPFLRDSECLPEALYRHRKSSQGPKVVAIGGGHGLATLLRGLKAYTSNITAIVTVADDGGSSGRLRRALGVLPPGDFRNCIAALADDEALMVQLFQYRFPTTGKDAGLDGHSFGNLFITAMAEVTGSFERALLESSRVLAIRGEVLPSTLHNVTLMGDLREEASAESVRRVAGESTLTQTQGVIERVYLEPDDVPAYPPAVRAILEADLVVAGPGSLYTSVLPNLLVREIAQAVAATRAVRVYVCNVATQRGETDGYSVGDHVAALERHVGRGLFPIVLANDNFAYADRLPEGVEPPRLEVPPDATWTLVTADLVDPQRPWRHDSEKLARALIRLLEKRR